MTRFVAILALLFVTPAVAQQVPAPINAPAAVTSGHALCGTTNRQQAADCGVIPGTVTDVTASSPLSSSGGPTPNLAIANPLPPANGGTGIANASGNTLTLGGAVIFSAGGTGALLGTAQTFTATQTFSNATYSALFTGGTVGIGTATPCTVATTVFFAHLGTNENFGINLGGAVSGPSLWANNDACSAYTVLAINGNPLVINKASGGKVGINVASPQAVLDINGGEKILITLVSALPSCASANEGERRGVSDATATTFGSTVAGSGSNHVPVYCNGTNWIIG
jgi:hypothetical protein